MKRIIFLCFILLSSFSLPAQEKGTAFEMNKRLGKGINIGNTFEAPTENAWGNPWNPSYFRMIAGLGFSHVRLPIRWDTSERTMTEPPYTISGNFLERIKGVVDEALKNKLHIIINMHHHESLFKDPAGQKARFLSQWQQIADYFKTYPDSLLFEILNEPQEGLANAGLWNQFAAEALSEIRKTNPNRYVLICSSNWSGTSGLDLLELPNDKNLILTVHYYNPFDFTHQGADFANMEHITGIKWLDTEIEREAVRQDFREVKLFSEKHNIPVHVGEFGTYNKADMDSRARWTTFLSRFFDEQGYSWAYWEFSSGFGIYNPATEKYQQPLVNALLHNPLPKPTPFKTSVIYESDFEKNGQDGWYFQTLSNATGDMSNENNQLTIKITKEGTDSWHLQLMKFNIPIEKDKQYRLTFTASASKECTASSYVGRNDSPWDAYSDYYPFKLYKTNESYSFVFTMKSSDDPLARIVFDLGVIPAPATLSFSNIKLEKIQVDYTSNTHVGKQDDYAYFDSNQNNLVFNNNGTYNKATIFSISGTIISTNTLTQGINSIYSGNWRQGIYVIVLEGNNIRQSHKILKN